MPTGPANRDARSAAALGPPRAHQTLWRLPLLAFLATGFICLKYLDGRLRSDYERSAADLATQADALIETAVAHRAASVRTLSMLIGQSRSAAEEQARLAVFGRAEVDSSPEVLQLLRLDERGEVRRAYPHDASGRTLSGESHLLHPETAGALARAHTTGAPAASDVMRLGGDTLGFIIYAPVVEGGRLTGYVASAVAYEPLLRRVLTTRVHDRVGYRVTDSAGRLLAVSPGYSARAAELVTRTIALPGGGAWRLEVPLGFFQPRTARAVMWAVGVVLLLIVFLLVVRENARAERIAMHSFNLELLSRDLLDSNVRLEERAQQVTEANMAKSRFLANVSHELRTPLNAIVGYNALALSGLYGEIPRELREAHHRIRTSAEHLLRVVNDVLDLSKLEVGRMSVHPTPVALEPLLNDVISSIEPVADAKGVRIDLVVARDVPLLITDERHVRQILLNLTSNAIKFTERGSVTLVAKRGDGPRAGRILVAVEDTGIGIDPADLGRIFDEFEQVRPGARGDSIVRGAGLGLTVSRKLARLLGGDVVVDSHPGAGSRFTLELPVEPPPLSAVDESRPFAGPRDRGPAPTCAEVPAPVGQRP